MLDEEIRVVNTPLISHRKRKTECLAEVAIPVEDDDSIPSKAPPPFYPYGGYEVNFGHE
jgi:hypothetical protein